MGKYLEDEELDSVLKSYFNEDNNYDNYAEPEVREQVKNHFKNPKYMILVGLLLKIIMEIIFLNL